MYKESQRPFWKPLVKMNYIAFIALSLMSAQAGKIFQVFYELHVNPILFSR